MSQEIVFQTAFDNLCQAVSRLEDNHMSHDGDITLDDFWLSETVTANFLSNEVTKMCILFSKPPTPAVEEIEKILKRIENHYTTLLSNFSNLPQTHGKVLLRTIRRAVLHILESLKDVFQSLKITYAEGQTDYLRLAGCLWESCEALEYLPRYNRDAVCKELAKELELVVDALQEIENEVNAHTTNLKSGNEEEDNSEQWSNEDFIILPACVAVVRTARACLRRIHRAVSSERCSVDNEHIIQLDTLVERAVYISPAVDDFISSVYPPVNKINVKNMASDLVQKLQSMLAVVENSYYVHTGEEWVEFLLKAVDHNNNKLQPLLT